MEMAMTQLRALVVIGFALFAATLGESLAVEDATPSVDLDRQQESPAPVSPSQTAVPSAKANDEPVGDAAPTAAQRQATAAADETEDEEDEKDAQPTPTAPAEELFTPSEEISEDLAVPFPVDI